MDLFNKILRIEDENGKTIDIRMPSVFKSEEIRERMIELMRMTSEEGIVNLTFSQAYLQVKKFRKLVNTIMNLVDVDATQISCDYLVQLLLPHEGLDEEGKVEYVIQGELLTFIFGKPDPDAPVRHKKEDVDVVAKLVGELWAITEDFQETINILNTLNYKDLNTVLGHRSETLMSPEDRMKKQQQEASKKLVERISQEGIKVENKEAEELSEEDSDRIMRAMMK